MDYISNYKAFLGVKNPDDFYVSAIYRDLPINGTFYYPLIETKFSDKTIISVSPSFYTAEFKDLSLNVLKSETYKQIQKRHPQCIKKEFIRFFIEKPTSVFQNNAITLDFSHKNFFMKTGKNLDTAFKENRWKKIEKLIEQKRIFAQIKDKKIVSMCKISDIYCDIANLYVYTDENYRHCGFGKNVVALACDQCLKNNLIPTYFDESKNTASLNLARAINFKQLSTEHCLCYIK